MKKYKKLHQIYLHYLLASRRLTVDEYHVLTSLTEPEIRLWFAPGRLAIARLVKVLGSAVLYQAKTDRSWLLSQQSITQRQYLWANTLGIELVTHGAKNLCQQRLGLALLAEHNPRNALIWAMRLRKSVPSSILAVRSTAQLGVFISQVAKDSNINLRLAQMTDQTWIEEI